MNNFMKDYQIENDRTQSNLKVININLKSLVEKVAIVILNLNCSRMLENLKKLLNFFI